MMVKKIILFLMAMVLCVGSVSAWQVHSDQYNGTVEFYQDGTGVATIDGYPTSTFTWNGVGDNQYEAHYWFYTVAFNYDTTNGTIVSDRFPGAYMTR